MSKTNCVNCGAAKDTSEIKCPFCGTTYLDLTAIDFSSNAPVVCEFVLPYVKDRIILSTLAVPELKEISYESTTTTMLSDRGTYSANCRTQTDVNIGIEFHPVARDNVLFSMKKDG